ncbi:MAG TPA: Rossmann-like and DUF2520 domain-containing protein [Thermoanaerobaculia bacterium]
MSAAPLEGFRFSLAGPGRVGSSLAAWLTALGAERVALAGRRKGDGRIPLYGLESAGQDLLLVAVSDASLDEVAAELARRPQARVVLHTSGSRDASALAPLREGGSAVGSLHPLKAFPEPLPDPTEARGVFFAVDGDAPARELAVRLAESWGGVAAEVPPESRALYHFAATLAAGGVTTLLAAASEIAGRLGLPAEVTRGYLELCRGALNAAARTLDAGHPLAEAITGPAARGDEETLKRHFEALRSLDPERLPLAEVLAEETRRVTGRPR